MTPTQIVSVLVVANVVKASDATTAEMLIAACLNVDGADNGADAKVKAAVGKLLNATPSEQPAALRTRVLYRLTAEGKAAAKAGKQPTGANNRKVWNVLKAVKKPMSKRDIREAADMERADNEVYKLQLMGWVESIPEAE